MKITFAFWTGLLLADTTVTPTVWKMSALAFGIAMLSGALHQAELKQSKTLFDSFIKCMFSGLAGFIVYAFTRDLVEDPLLLIVEFIFAGAVGSKFVKRLTVEWLKKL